MPHTGSRKQSQQKGCEDCIDRTGHHSQQRKAGDRILYGLPCYWASTGRRHQGTGPSMPTPFHQIPTRLQNFKMKLIRFESIFWSVPHDLVSQKEGLIWARPLSQDRMLITVLFLLPVIQPVSGPHAFWPTPYVSSKAQPFLFPKN